MLITISYDNEANLLRVFASGIFDLNVYKEAMDKTAVPVMSTDAQFHSKIRHVLCEILHDETFLYDDRVKLGALP